MTTKKWRTVMPFSKLSPICVFTTEESADRSFLKEIYAFAQVSRIHSAEGIGKDGDGLRVSGGCLSVRQELTEALKEKYILMSQKEKDLVNIFLPILFRGFWDRAFLHRWESSGQIFLVRQIHL